MFDRIKKAFSAGGRAASHSASGDDSVSEWAASQGLSFAPADGRGFSLKGHMGNKPWRMERGRPSRNYIQGEELRARAELGLSDEVAVMVMSRSLKEVLEKKAYSIYTDDLQTMADPNLPEEMRWLAMYQEVGWDSMPRPFWTRYAVLSDSREHALAWIDPQLARQLMEWPEPAPGPEVPFILMLMRGKGYLRMQYKPAEMTTLQHATAVFTSACDAAIGAFAGVPKR